MDRRIHISYLGLVRNVIGRREETVNAPPGTTIGELLQFLAAKHGDPFQHSVFQSGGALRATAQICLDDHDISELQGFATQLGDGEQVSVIVGVYQSQDRQRNRPDDSAERVGESTSGHQIVARVRRKS